MANAITEVERFQTDRLLDRQEHNASNEATNIIEELLEVRGYDVPKGKRAELMILIEEFFNDLIQKLGLKKIDKDLPVDGYLDIIVFSIGAVMKLGYKPECALNEVAKEINSRTGKIIDGKFIKDTNVKTYKADFSKCKNKK
jgi:hypothetical protein